MYAVRSNVRVVYGDENAVFDAERQFVGWKKNQTSESLVFEDEDRGRREKEATTKTCLLL
jgi:hypothetical protein